MSDEQDNDEKLFHQGHWAQGVGGYIEYRVWTTPVEDTVRHHLPVPPTKVIPIIFLPGIMGSNLRLSKKRMEELQRMDSRGWRPDDLVSADGTMKIVYGFTPLPGNSDSYPGWLKNASPTQRQMIFDPNETEVDYYHYTENKEQFDPEGKETEIADRRHRNVPDKLHPIPPMLVNAPPPPDGCNFFVKSRKYESAAHKARWRGWSEVMFDGAYGALLKTVEGRMNNLLLQSADRMSNNPVQFLDTPPKAFGGNYLPPVTVAELQRIADCWYPVHAMGYNWLKSNGENAIAIAPRIRELIRGYQRRGMECTQVMLVTHSMGGLLARALMHPSYGKLTEDEVLGIYHNAMPATGAAITYKRMRTGIEGAAGLVAGDTGKKVTPVLANSPGGLELLPSEEYGGKWLNIVDKRGVTLASWPDFNTSAVEAIYTQPAHAWWRLFNPDWVNPAKVRDDQGGGVKNAMMRVKDAAAFHKKIKNTFHPTTYASYCESLAQKSHEVVEWEVDQPLSPLDLMQDPPERWELIGEDGKNAVTVQTRTGKILRLKLLAPRQAGDGTVPAARSAARVHGTKFIHGYADNTANYDHQNSFANAEVLSSTLYSLVKIANKAKWWAQ